VSDIVDRDPIFDEDPYFDAGYVAAGSGYDPDEDDYVEKPKCGECNGNGFDWEGLECPQCDGYGYLWFL